jgi:hypothetical protein
MTLLSAPLNLPRRLPAEVLAALGLAVVGSVAILTVPLLALAGALGLAVMLCIAVRPALGAYLLIGLTPLIAGIDRGAVIPLLRPNEALLLLVIAPLLVRGLLTAVTRSALRFRFTALDAAIVAMAVCSSLVPLLWMVARQREVSGDDLLYAVTLWKYYALYLAVRVGISRVDQLRRCLAIAMLAGAVVGLLAILQSLGLFGVPELLGRWYAPFGDQTALEIQRGTSLLASSFAVADVMIFNLAIAVAALAKGVGPRLPLMGLSGLFVVGCLASGQFSGIIALFVGLAVVGWVTGTLRRGALMAAPLLVAGGALMQPVLERRLSGFSTSRGLPPSWIARYENLERFFWPDLFSNFNWLFGVRPSARVPAPAAEWWREWVWIESGHTWLLWNGGIPLFVAFFVFLWVVVRTARRSVPRLDETGVLAASVLSAVAVIFVLTTFDPHLTLRGAGDMFFALLALLFVQSPRGSWGVSPALGAEGPAAGTRGSWPVSAGRPPTGMVSAGGAWARPALARQEPSSSA